MNSIIEKTNELVDTIKYSENYKKYLSLKNQLSSNKEIMNIIDEVKSKQKELVKLKVYNKDHNSLEKELSSLQDKLNSYPIYVEYNYLLEDLNQEFQIIKNTIEDVINNKLN